MNINLHCGQMYISEFLEMKFEDYKNDVQITEKEFKQIQDFCYGRSGIVSSLYSKELITEHVLKNESKDIKNMAIEKISDCAYVMEEEQDDTLYICIIHS